MPQLNKLWEFQPEDLLEKNENHIAKFKKQMRCIIESVSVIQKEIKEAQRMCHTLMESVRIIVSGACKNVLDMEEKSGEISTEKPTREEEISTTKQIREPTMIQAWQRNLIIRH